MGNPSWLEQYYASDIRPMQEEGVSQVKIREVLKEKYGVEVPRSTLSDFLKSLEDGNGRMPSHATGEGADTGRIEEMLARYEALTQELCTHMARLIADGQEAARGSEARHGALVAMLGSLRAAGAEQPGPEAGAFEALAQRMEAAAGFNSWVKASLYTGPACGVVFVVIYHWLVT
jgi:hypothetical protein